MFDISVNKLPFQDYYNQEYKISYWKLFKYEYNSNE